MFHGGEKVIRALFAGGLMKILLGLDSIVNNKPLLFLWMHYHDKANLSIN